MASSRTPRTARRRARGAGVESVLGSTCRNTWGTRLHRGAKERASAAGAATRATQAEWRRNKRAMGRRKSNEFDAHERNLHTWRMQSAHLVLSSQRREDVNRSLRPLASVHLPRSRRRTTSARGDSSQMEYNSSHYIETSRLRATAHERRGCVSPYGRAPRAYSPAYRAAERRLEDHRTPCRMRNAFP